jgi:hypothetical protein
MGWGGQARVSRGACVCVLFLKPLRLPGVVSFRPTYHRRFPPQHSLSLSHIIPPHQLLPPLRRLRLRLRARYHEIGSCSSIRRLIAASQCARRSLRMSWMDPMPVLRLFTIKNNAASIVSARPHDTSMRSFSHCGGKEDRHKAGPRSELER